MEKPKEYSRKSKEVGGKQKHMISISDLMTNHILEGKNEIRGMKLKDVEEEKNPIQILNSILVLVMES